MPARFVLVRFLKLCGLSCVCFGRISLTERCNLRCTYCMPEEGVELQGAGKMLSRDEIIQLATLFAECGLFFVY